MDGYYNHFSFLKVYLLKGLFYCVVSFLSSVMVEKFVNDLVGG